VYVLVRRGASQRAAVSLKTKTQKVSPIKELETPVQSSNFQLGQSAHM
jgi:hypothetical protein